MPLGLIIKRPGELRRRLGIIDPDEKIPPDLYDLIMETPPGNWITNTTGVGFLRIYVDKSLREEANLGRNMLGWHRPEKKKRRKSKYSRKQRILNQKLSKVAIEPKNKPKTRR